MSEKELWDQSIQSTLLIHERAIVLHRTIACDCPKKNKRESLDSEQMGRGCQEAALTRHTSWRRSGGGVGLGPSGKQLHPATPELTAWQERLADSLQ